MISKKLQNIELPKGGVFDVLKNANDAEKLHGKDAVIKSVIGSLFDEDENFFVLDIVKETYKNLSIVDIFNYDSAITGTPEYKELVKKNIFASHLPHFKDSFISIHSTPGGTGAIGNAIRAYTDEGQSVLLPNIRWESYSSMADANSVKYVDYNLFKGDAFDLSDFSTKLIEIAKRDKKVLAVINDPCHNPTGYSLSLEEWKSIVESLKEAAKYGDVVLVNDVAYIDYDFRGVDASREYLKLFAGLPSNILVLLAFSISKSLTSYGLRVGASVAISSSEEVINVHNRAFEILSRTTWSNISRGGSTLFMQLNGDEKKYQKLSSERNEITAILKKRADIFCAEAQKVELKCFPFRSGFFITVIVADNIKQKVIDNLKDKNAFVVPVVGGLRIALCSLTIKKATLLPKLIKDSML
jgi:aspartate aminotransferase/aromatic-amino-acid transaminase